MKFKFWPLSLWVAGGLNIQDVPGDRNFFSSNYQTVHETRHLGVFAVTDHESNNENDSGST